MFVDEDLGSHPAISFIGSRFMGSLHQPATPELARQIRLYMLLTGLYVFNEVSEG